MRLLTYAELKPKKGIPYSRETVRRLRKLKQFPEPVKTGSRAIAWLETDLDAHIAAMGWSRETTIPQAFSARRQLQAEGWVATVLPLFVSKAKRSAALRKRQAAPFGAFCADWKMAE